MVLYFKIIVELSSWIRVKFEGRNGDRISRQVLHCSMASLVIFWNYFDVTPECWSWRLNAVVPAVMLSRLIFKGAILRDPDDPDVQNLSLSSSPNDLLFGPLLFTGVMVWAGMYKFMTEEAAILAAAALGDGIAPLIGTSWGRHIFQVPFGNRKTMEGSVVGVFLGTAASMPIFLYLMNIPLLPLRIILAYSGIAAVAEGTAPCHLDNLVMPIVLHFSLDRVQELLPA